MHSHEGRRWRSAAAKRFVRVCGKPRGPAAGAAAALLAVAGMPPRGASAALLVPFVDFTPSLLPFQDAADDPPNLVPFGLFILFNVLVQSGALGKAVWPDAMFDSPFDKSVAQIVEQARQGAQGSAELQEQDGEERKAEEL